MVGDRSRLLDVSASVMSVAPAMRSFGKGILGAKALGGILDNPRSYKDSRNRAIKAMEVAQYHRRIQLRDYYAIASNKSGSGATEHDVCGATEHVSAGCEGRFHA